MGEADQTIELSKDYNGSIEYPLKCVFGAPSIHHLRHTSCIIIIIYLFLGGGGGGGLGLFIFAEDTVGSS